MIESKTEWTSLQSQYIWYDVVYIDYYSFDSQNKIKKDYFSFIFKVYLYLIKKKKRCDTAK